MNKTLMLIGAGALLAGCGSTQVGSAALTITDLRTEYQTAGANGQYVACDNVAQKDGTITQKTRVAVSFTASGDVASLNVALVGSKSGQTGGYETSVSGEQLKNLGGDSFKVTFDADATKSPLPQSIVVNPAPTTIKIVEPVGDIQGNFYTRIIVTNGAGNSGTATSAGFRRVLVYSTCNVVSDTGTAL